MITTIILVSRLPHSRFPAAGQSQHKIADNIGNPGAGQPAAENKYSPDRNYGRVAEAG
jgi:hypothetical protein